MKVASQPTHWFLRQDIKVVIEQVVLMGTSILWEVRELSETTKKPGKPHCFYSLSALKQVP